MINDKWVIIRMVVEPTVSFLRTSATHVSMAHQTVYWPQSAKCQRLIWDYLSNCGAKAIRMKTTSHQSNWKKQPPPRQSVSCCPPAQARDQLIVARTWGASWAIGLFEWETVHSRGLIILNQGQPMSTISKLKLVHVFKVSKILKDFCPSRTVQ